MNGSAGGASGTDSEGGDRHDRKQTATREAWNLRAVRRTQPGVAAYGADRLYRLGLPAVQRADRKVRTETVCAYRGTYGTFRIERRNRMKCIRCGCDTYTITTRERVDAYVRRRKECHNCGARFATYEFSDEVVQEVLSLLEGRKNMITQIRKRLPKFYPPDGKGKKNDRHDPEKMGQA